MSRQDVIKEEACLPISEQQDVIKEEARLPISKQQDVIKEEARLPVSEQQDIIKDGVDLRRWLQQAYHGGEAHHMGGVRQELDHAVGGGAVQACADLIHQQHTLHHQRGVGV